MGKEKPVVTLSRVPKVPPSMPVSAPSPDLLAELNPALRDETAPPSVQRAGPSSDAAGGEGRAVSEKGLPMGNGSHPSSMEPVVSAAPPNPLTANGASSAAGSKVGAASESVGHLFVLPPAPKRRGYVEDENGKVWGTLNIRLPAEVREDLEKAARAKNMNLTQFVIAVLKAARITNYEAKK